jgi:putative ABC transport system permease protein
MHLNDPVGKIISVQNKKGTVVGVVNNFNAIQLNGPYVPVIITNQPLQANMMMIRFTGDKNDLKKKLKVLYEKYESYIPFSPFLMEDSFEETNQFADNAAKVLSLLGLLAMFLSCMGLFGLASFNIESRTKEIGIRKSNGASTVNILMMFLKSYSKWIIIASCIALPLSFIAWNTLLNVFFAFRIPFPLSSLIITPIIVLLIAWSTIIWQSWKAAGKNPVDALRYE